MEFKNIGSSGLDYSTLYPSFSIMSSVGSGISSPTHSTISKYGLSKAGSFLGDNRKAPGMEENNFAALPHRKKRKSVSFKDTAHISCYRKYHQAQIVNRVHLLPQDTLDPHTFISFWGMPGAKSVKVTHTPVEDYSRSRTYFESLSELFTAGKLSLKEITLNSGNYTLRGALTLRSSMTSSYASPSDSLTNLQQAQAPDRIEVSYSFNRWERSTTVVAYRVMETPISNDVGVPIRKSRYEYVFEISLRQSDQFVSDIDTEINFILSRNQDLFAKSALIWNGRCEFKVAHSDLNWEFACHVSKVRPPPKYGHNSRNADEKYLLDLAETGYKLNDEVDLTPSGSAESTPAMSLEDLVMATDESLVLDPDSEMNGLTKKLIIDDAELAMRHKHDDDISEAPTPQENPDAASPFVKLRQLSPSVSRSNVRDSLMLDTSSSPLVDNFDSKRSPTLGDRKVPDLVNLVSPSSPSPGASKSTTPSDTTPETSKPTSQKSSMEYSSSYSTYRTSSIYVNMSFF